MRKTELGKFIEVPEFAQEGIFQCRVLYDDRKMSVEFLPYSPRQVRSLKIVFSDDICYPYKYINRDKINRLFDMRGEADDILIVKFGKVTDSSYSNVIFRDNEGNWITPSSFLLPGTRRAGLLKSMKIEEADIAYDDITKFAEVKLINAMMGIDDTESIPLRNIIAS